MTSTPLPARRGAIALFALLLTVVVGFGAAPARAAAPVTISLTFDDGTASEYWARAQLSSHAMNATFYINTSRVGTSDYYMTWNQIKDLASDGNEIAGHTAMHTDLTKTDPAEAQRQICQDRANLVTEGLPAPTDLAYPYGAYNTSVQQWVQGCGYNSARAVTPVVAESIPPADPYAIRTGPGTDLTSLQNEVTAAEQRGGWAPLVFHQICNACDTDWISQSDFSGFLDWLSGEVAAGRVVLKTVQQVVGGATQPVVNGPAAPPAPNGWNGLRNASMEYDTDSDLSPDCWQYDTYGSNSLTWSRTTDAHTGTYAERVDVSNYVSGDAKLKVASDLGSCMPSVTPGHRYVITEWYKSSAPVNFTAFTRDSMGAIDFWDSSSTFPASSTWRQASWTTQPIPAGKTGISFGLTIAANGFLTVDDAAMNDASPTGSDTTPPTVSITSPTGGTVAGTTPITVSASDNTAIDHVDFLIDGTVVGTATGQYTYNWDARKVANGFHTIKARAVDVAGNTTTTSAVTVNVSNSTVNLAQNPSLESASGSTPTCWLLGGYGTNSFTWTRTSDAHTGSFAELLSISSLTSGDRKLVTAQDSGTCAIAATPGHTYTVSDWYKTGFSGLPVMFAYYRNSAGSWTYWATSSRFAAASNWTQATWTTPALPAGATAISVGMGLNMVGSVTTDDYNVYDNSPPPDTTAPTSTILCNTAKSDDGGCISGYYNSPVPIALQATDEAGGSGVASIKYTTNGTDPSTTNGLVYNGEFTVGQTATVKWRAFDNAGNAEAVHSQLIQIDEQDPTSTIACAGAACSSGYYSAAVGVTLSATDTGGSGVFDIVYTTDGSDPTITNGNIYLGRFSVTSTTTVKWRAYDNAGNAEAINSRLIQIDSTAPNSTISCGLQACSTSPYFSPVSVTLAATDAGGSGVASIVYTTDGSDPTSSNGTTYSGAFTVSSTTTVKYRAFDNAGNAEPINSQVITVGLASATLTTPTDGQAVSGTINMNVTANGIDVDHVDFLVDGAVVGTVSVGPYTFGWDSTTVSDGMHTVVAHVFDTSNNETDTNSAGIDVSNFASDNTPPTSSITCNDGSCGGSFNSAVSVKLSATDDSGGSGVQEIVYTTDGSDPSLSNGTVYGGSFSVSSTTTVKYRAYDNAGNAEAINSQTIQIDTVAPSSSIACNGAACAGTYYGAAVSVTLSATDSGGSGVQKIRYTTDGTVPNSSNGTDYSGAFTLSANTTVRYRAWDNAGNIEPTNVASIHVDTTAPQSSIACNGGSCSGWFRPGASVTLSATDADSGVASIKYTTDGSTPTATNGTTYSSAFTVNATTTVKYRAFDQVGNAEAVNSQQVQIDSTNPTASVTAPATGSLAAGTVAVTANASDNVAVDHVDLLVDGSSVATTTTSPYSFNWNSTTVGDGTHSLAARAVDSAGNTATSTAVTVTVINHNLLSNPSLETATGSTPTCWLLGGYGTNTFTWTRTSDAHTGSFGELLSMTAWTSGDRKLVNVQDTGTCAPPASPGHTYTITAWYKSDTTPSIFAFYRSSSGAWTYWATSSLLPAAASWTQARFTTPAVPAGATNVSVGIGLTKVGSLTTDDFGLFLTG
jgi:peptidoglycan/xylan/chitin deacetylase (PgdA/CDA1 family)/archaellum component FlaF (FlaF/FlaG flagellin family)